MGKERGGDVCEQGERKPLEGPRDEPVGPDDQEQKQRNTDRNDQGRNRHVREQ